jgi:U4/U6.U5 tri-snRNP-associated protein 3
VSFKVTTRDGNRDHEPQHSQDQHPQQSQEDGDRYQSKGRFDPEPMDEDEEEEEELEVEDGGMDDMAAMMGFGGFGSTKGQKVLGNNVGAARKESKTEYRQYMNRVGGFNRPLSPTR